jgi:PhzF family phenazine biosynthesis protein
MGACQSHLFVAQVDAFASRAFEGNPAAVCLLSQPLPDETMQKIAEENNLSETAFVEPRQLSTSADRHKSDASFKNDTRFKLRWFTPLMEVPLCGHATLASGAVVLNHCDNPTVSVDFETLSGRLTVRRDAASGLLAMDLPLLDPVEELPSEDFKPGSGLLSATVGDSVEIEQVLYEPSLRYLVVVLKPPPPTSHCVQNTDASREFIEAIKPDFDKMEAAHTEHKLVGIIVTVMASSLHTTAEVDEENETCIESALNHFYSRFLAPWAGIREDPVTGSAHSVLGPYWGRRLGRNELRARQCSKRGGDVIVRVDNDKQRCVILGNAVTVLQGEFLAPAN